MTNVDEKQETVNRVSAVKLNKTDSSYKQEPSVMNIRNIFDHFAVNKPKAFYIFVNMQHQQLLMPLFEGMANALLFTDFIDSQPVYSVSTSNVNVPGEGKNPSSKISAEGWTQVRFKEDVVHYFGAHYYGAVEKGDYWEDVRAVEEVFKDFVRDVIFDCFKDNTFKPLLMVEVPQ